MKENKGTYITSNTLIDLVRYENIIRFDSDDIMMDNMIRDVLIYDNYNNIRFKCLKMCNNIIDKNSDNTYPHGVAFFKKSLFDELGGYQPWKCAADSELLIRGNSLLLEKYIDKPLFFRRIHDDSLTRSNEFGYKSDIREEYRKLIGKHESIKITKITNQYDEY